MSKVLTVAWGDICNSFPQFVSWGGGGRTGMWKLVTRGLVPKVPNTKKEKACVLFMIPSRWLQLYEWRQV